jgi:hypothetical protein
MLASDHITQIALTFGAGHKMKKASEANERLLAFQVKSRNKARCLKLHILATTYSPDPRTDQYHRPWWA